MRATAKIRRGVEDVEERVLSQGFVRQHGFEVRRGVLQLEAPVDVQVLRNPGFVPAESVLQGHQPVCKPDELIRNTCGPINIPIRPKASLHPLLHRLALQGQVPSSHRRRKHLLVDALLAQCLGAVHLQIHADVVVDELLVLVVMGFDEIHGQRTLVQVHEPLCLPRLLIRLMFIGPPGKGAAAAASRRPKRSCRSPTFPTPLPLVLRRCAALFRIRDPLRQWRDLVVNDRKPEWAAPHSAEAS
mmetsp:Transcript_46948/g.150891  ORF Transcript_46948/g.150891 Transcript_46948/m.150891 type:complete len:244 (-) Transcript_46948:125-856(-)